MFETIAIPVWALILIALFAALAFVERILGPWIRWFFRKRAERVVARLNTRLQRPIEPFKLARRYDMIQRLKYDPEVALEIAAHAKKTGVSQEVAFKQAERYAREIVPSFSATAYFGFGTRAARWLSKLLYRVQTDTVDDEQLARIDPDATVVFVMNHRSNMDYVLVTWLVADRSALSYAVGEWARIWPLSSLIRSMGAFFIRRKSRGALYRKVLARYVQMATENGVTQAVFPEGGLSLDGKIAEPKLGFLSYIVSRFDAETRDVIFIPVAINYDRILEDRVLMSAHEQGERRFRASIPTALRFGFRQIGKKLRGTFEHFGVASVSFGPPLSLAHFAEGPDQTKRLAEELKRRIETVVPVLPVPLVASVLETAPGTANRADIVEQATARLADLSRLGAQVHIVEDSPEKTVQAGLNTLSLRKMIKLGENTLEINEDERTTLTFYANSIRHLFDDAV